MLPADSRPAPIDCLVETVSEEEFEEIAQFLTSQYPEKLAHVDRFRKAGIRAHEGPKTCMRCHEYAQIEDAKTGEVKNVEARWIPMDPSMEISHAIRRAGSLTCADCHSPDGVLDRQELGYTDAAIEMYQHNPLE